MPKCQLNGKIGLRNMDRPTDKQIADVLAGLASAEEAKRVAQWFATDAGSAYLSEAFDLDMKSIRPGNEDLYVPHAIPSEEVWRRIKKQIRRYRVHRMLFRVAAVVLPFVLLLGLYYQVDSRVELFGDTGYEEVYVPKGERLQMMFQDGTKVYLNSDTRLRYPKKFGLDSREVELSGEAYFVVSKNEKRPFIVELDGPSIHVTGTAFNVQSYPDEKEITVSLDEGRINMQLVSDKEIPVLPGQQAVYDKEHDACRILRGEDMEYLSMWKQDIIAFKDTPLSEVLVKLRRWYDVAFEVSGDVPEDLLITLTSEQTLLENVLRDLGKITPLTFEYDAKKRLVRVSKCKDAPAFPR